MRPAYRLLFALLAAPAACSVETLTAPPSGESPVGGGGTLGQSGKAGAGGGGASGAGGATAGVGGSITAGASGSTQGGAAGNGGTVGAGQAGVAGAGAAGVAGAGQAGAAGVAGAGQAGAAGVAGAGQAGAAGVAGAGQAGAAGAAGAGQAGAAGASGSAGAAGGCAADEKVCGGGCVKKSDPLYGCADATCSPCSATTADSAVCSGAACMSVACSGSLRNCNTLLPDACEVDTNTDEQNCGACGKSCSTNHVAPQCTSGICGGACASGFGDCNTDIATDGCEVDLLASATHCGACGAACDPNALAVCEQGTCSNTRATWKMPNSANDVAVGAPNPTSLTDLGDGTVRDDVTGLMWMKASGASASYAQSLANCRALTLGSHTDWRLPSLVELASIVDVSKSNPILDATKFTGTQLTAYWTTGLLPGGFVASIDFSFAQVYPQNPGGTGPYRCVRSTKASTPGGYTVTTDTVHDKSTNLIWQRDATAPLGDWPAAKAYCAGLTIAGGGFRVPTLKELMTLLDPRATPPHIDTTAFPTATAPYWSGSDIGNGRSFYVHYGDATSDSFHQMNDSALVRCVKTGP